MHLRRLIGLSGVLSYLSLPGALVAQVAGGVEFYGALDNAAPITRTIGGLSLSVGTPYLGIRGSGGLGISSLATDAFAANQGPSNLVWATNADLMFGPVNARLGEGFMPYAFGGLGLESSAQPATFTDAIRTWSYGGGLQLALGRILSINGEVRSRHLPRCARQIDTLNSVDVLDESRAIETGSRRSPAIAIRHSDVLFCCRHYSASGSARRGGADGPVRARRPGRCRATGRCVRGAPRKDRGT